MNATQALLLIARTDFSAFTDADWCLWAGCTSDAPLIGYNGSYTILIDGDVVNIVSDDATHIFFLSDGDFMI